MGFRITCSEPAQNAKPRNIKERHWADNYTQLHQDSRDAKHDDGSNCLTMMEIDQIQGVQQQKLETVTLLNAFYPYQGYGVLEFALYGVYGDIGVPTSFTLDVSKKVYTATSLNLLQDDLNIEIKEQLAIGPVPTVIPQFTVLAEGGKILFYTDYPLEFNSMTDPKFAGRWFGIAENTGNQAVPNEDGTWGDHVQDTPQYKAIKNRTTSAYAHVLRSNQTPTLGGWPYVIISDGQVTVDSSIKTVTPYTTAITSVICRLPIDASKFGTTTCFTRHFFSDQFLDGQTINQHALRFWRPDGVPFDVGNWPDLVSLTFRTWYSPMKS